MNHRGSYLGGAILIFLGVIFLLSNLGFLGLSGNWWAFFIILPSVWSWINGWNQYRANGGRVTPAVVSAFTWGSIPFLIGVIFLFNLSWGIFWPLMLIFAGVSALIQSRIGGAEGDEEEVEWDS